jgi:hypothetical protein
MSSLISRITFSLLLCLGSTGFCQTPVVTTAAGTRTWTTTDGRLFQATLLSSDGVQAVLRLANGQTGSLALVKLSPTDQVFVRTSLGMNTPLQYRAGDLKMTEAKSGPLLQPEKRIWPVKVEPDSIALEVKLVSEVSAAQQYVYHSQNFEFLAQDKLIGPVMKEVARTFEATRSLLEALPWGIQPKPPADLGYYRAKFYVDRKHYIEEGGPVNSGGVYFRKDRVFRIPFQSLGLEMRGKVWVKNENYNNQTIVHEATHQMMHDFLDFMPIWAVEGTAEYTSMLPLHNGRFASGSHERGIKDYLKNYQERSGSFADLVSPLELLRMTSEEWHQRSNTGGREQSRLYFSACMLVYFFSHLDGDRHGTAFLQYMDKLREGRDAWAEFFKQPGVQRNPDGTFSYPRSLPMPAQAMSEAYGIEQVEVLINGRDDAQLKRAFADGFKKIGITKPPSTPARPL